MRSSLIRSSVDCTGDSIRPFTVPNWRSSGRRRSGSRRRQVENISLKKYNTAFFCLFRLITSCYNILLFPTSIITTHDKTNYNLLFVYAYKSSSSSMMLLRAKRSLSGKAFLLSMLEKKLSIRFSTFACWR